MDSSQIAKQEIPTFKSTLEFYFDERDGLKNHTERVYDPDDWRHKTLEEWQAKGEYGRIKIVLVRDGVVFDDEFFIREVQHVCFWNGLIISTWRHEA